MKAERRYNSRSSLMRLWLVLPCQWVVARWSPGDLLISPKCIPPPSPSSSSSSCCPLPLPPRARPGHSRMAPLLALGAALPPGLALLLALLCSSQRWPAFLCARPWSLGWGMCCMGGAQTSSSMQWLPLVRCCGLSACLTLQCTVAATSSSSSMMQGLCCLWTLSFLM